MKLNKLLYISLVAVLFAACGNNDDYQKANPVADDAALLWFDNSDERGLELDPELNITSHDVTLSRQYTTEALTVNLNVTVNTENKFQVPTEVVFAAGEASKTFTVNFEGLEIGETYSLTLALDESAYNPYKTLFEDDDETYKVPFYYLTVTPIKYEDGKGIFYDDILTTYGGAPRTAWWIDYQVATLPDGSKKIRILNPYYAVAEGDPDENGIYPECPFNEEGDLLEAGDYNIYLNISLDGVVDMETFDLGIDWGYGPVFAQLYSAYGEYYEDSVITFSRADHALANGDDDGLYNYAGFDLYLNLDAYVAATYVEPAEASVEDYVGAWTLYGIDYDTEEEVTLDINIETDEDEYGQYYIISGIDEDAPEIYGYFDEKTNTMSWQASLGEVIEYDGEDYQTYFYPVDADGYLNDEITIDFVPGEDGNLEIAPNSASEEFAILYVNMTDDDDYFWGTDVIILSLEPQAAQQAPQKVAKYNTRKAHRFNLHNKSTRRQPVTATTTLRRQK